MYSTKNTILVKKKKMLKNTKICISATHKSNLYLMCEINVREYRRGNKKMDNNEKIDKEVTY